MHAVAPQHPPGPGPCRNAPCRPSRPFAAPSLRHGRLSPAQPRVRVAPCAARSGDPHAARVWARRPIPRARDAPGTALPAATQSQAWSGRGCGGRAPGSEQPDGSRAADRPACTRAARAGARGPSGARPPAAGGRLGACDAAAGVRAGGRAQRGGECHAGRRGQLQAGDHGRWQ